MADPSEWVEFPVRGDAPIGPLVRFPSGWAGEPAWLRDHGRRTVLVIDDQLQDPTDLTAPSALRQRVLEPLNVELAFCPECRTGTETARGQRWFPAVEARVRSLGDRLALVCLDLMFDGEDDPRSGSGVEFLARLRTIDPTLPVVILTQAEDERGLRERLADAGDEKAFLSKSSGDRVADLCRALSLSGLLSDPLFTAYSRPLRAGLGTARRYAATLALAMGGLPKPPLLIVGPSGEGKTELARRLARWLARVEPAVRPARAANPVVFPCSDFTGRDQTAQVTLFGRGRQEMREHEDAAGLAVRGRVHQAAGGVLVVDEVGNATTDLQQMLLVFAESGAASPVFPSDRMTSAALGPLDVLCLFTAQPAQLAGGQILSDLTRRFGRAGVIELPPLRDRPDDVLPVFHASQRERARAADPMWSDSDDLDDWLRPAAQTWLREKVVRHGLTASRLADLAIPDAPRLIGVPRLEARWRELGLPTTAASSAPVGLPGQTPAEQNPPPHSVAAGVRLTDDPRPFPRTAEALRGRLDAVVAAAAETVLAYLEAVLEVSAAGRDQPNFGAAYELATGTIERERNKVRSALAGVLIQNQTALRAAVRRSPWIRALAEDVRTRSKSVDELLRELEQGDSADG